jgi:hypothetical protein
MTKVLCIEVEPSYRTPKLSPLQSRPMLMQSEFVYSVLALDYLLENVWCRLDKHATQRSVEPLGKHIENQSHSQLQAILMYHGALVPRDREVSHETYLATGAEISNTWQSVYTLSAKVNENSMMLPIQI